jgi:benzoyl-CoA reductase/2-hydroxyglutaryl-CoA dehydratase subunit BcrC/BadD/HgdB
MFQKLQQYLMDRPLELKRMQDKGVKVIGTNVGDYVPTELIYAAGAAPICQIHGGDPDSVEAAHSVMTRFLCPFARAQIGYRLLKEQVYYEIVDKLIIGCTCQHLRKVADVWNTYTDVEIFRLGVPGEYDTDYSLAYYADALRRTKEWLETATGNKITDEKLKEAITIYNRLRELLKKISEMRKSSPPPISTLDFIKLNHASYLLDPKVMVEELGSICSKLERQKKGSANSKPRLLLIGPVIALGDYKVLNLVEEIGGEIVAEEICEGVRSYRNNVEISGGDLIQDLAVKYLRKRTPPAAFQRASLKPRFDYAVKLAGEFKVDGIIWYQVKICETYDIESFYFTQKMKEQNFPMLKLESEYDFLDKGSLKTRIEAFLEILKKRRQP